MKSDKLSQVMSLESVSVGAEDKSLRVLSITHPKLYSRVN